MKSIPKVSIIIPIHDMKGGAEFLWESINMLAKQTFQDFEIIITKEGKMAENTNAAIRRAHGEIIKILFLDDCFSTEVSLEDIVFHFDEETNWMITGTDDNPSPQWTDNIHTGNNKLGSPSALTFRNRDPLMFDENMSWLLDCDYYRRLYNRYGPPKILPVENVVIGKGDHQMTHILTDKEKVEEHEYINIKYKNNE